MAKAKKTKKTPINTPGNYVYGRPTIYTEDMPQKVFDYIKQSGFKYDHAKQCWIGKLPSKAGLAIYLGVVKRTLLDWADKYEEFSHALSFVEMYQEQELMNNGLNGVFNSTISKLILSSNHGYTERKDTTTNGDSVNNAFNITINGDNLESDKSTD
jgi:hypothetical protein